MAARDIPTAYHAVLARLDRPRQALIDELEQKLRVLHLTSDDLPAVSRLLNALLAGVENGSPT